MIPGMPDLPPHGPATGHEQEQGKAKGYKLPSMPGPLGMALAIGGVGAGGVLLFKGGQKAFRLGKTAWRKGRDFVGAKFPTLKNRLSATPPPASAASPVNTASADASLKAPKDPEITPPPVNPEKQNGILKRLLFSPSPGTHIRSDSGRSQMAEDIPHAAAVKSVAKPAEPPSGWWSRLPGPAKWGTIGGGLLTTAWGGLKGLAWIGSKMPAPEKVKTGLSAITYALGLVGKGTAVGAAAGGLCYLLYKAAQKEDPNAPKPRRKAFEDDPDKPPIKIVHLYDDPDYYYGRPYGMRRWTHRGDGVYGFHYPTRPYSSSGGSYKNDAVHTTAQGKADESLGDAGRERSTSSRKRGLLPRLFRSGKRWAKKFSHAGSSKRVKLDKKQDDYTGGDKTQNNKELNHFSSEVLIHKSDNNQGKEENMRLLNIFDSKATRGRKKKETNDYRAHKYSDEGLNKVTQDVFV